MRFDLEKARSYDAGEDALDSYDMSPVLFGTGKSARKAWFYFTEDELSPGAARVGNYKAVFNLRGDDGASTGGLAASRSSASSDPRTARPRVATPICLTGESKQRPHLWIP